MQPLGIVIAALLSGLIFGMASSSASAQEEIKFADCPKAVQSAFQAEAKGAKIETVNRERDDDDFTVYWAEAAIGGKTYYIGVLDDGTLKEMSLANDEEDIPLDRCPAPVQATFRSESFGGRIDTVGKDRKYGVVIYQTVVAHNERSYEIVVAEDGTLVEKVLVINDDQIKLNDCPAAVRTALHEHARGGEIGDITRFTGIGQHTFEAEIKLKTRVYSVEVAEDGTLISVSLEAVKE